MGLIKHMTAPIRSLVRFPLFQLAIVIGLILWLQSADETSTIGKIFAALDILVDATARSVASAFNVKSFTKSWLTTGFWIAYVYLACLMILWLARIATRLIVDLVGRSNAFWLRNAIARERGVAAYRAWEPFERIRPDSIPQPVWEEKFAWPADNKPPYPPLVQRMLLGTVINIAVVAAAAVLLQVFTPFPVLTWLGQLTKLLLG
jgi:hypothetical protein